MSLKSQLAAAVAKVAHPVPPDRGSAEAEDPPTTVPDPFLQLMERSWRAQPEDTVGGWCITLAEDPRTPADGALAIAMFLSRAVAVHIAEMHNQSLVGDKPEQPEHSEARVPGQTPDGPQAGPESPDAASPPG